MEKERGTTEVEVELDVFSGKQNPIWKLASAPAQRAVALLQKPGEAVRLAVVIPMLGYRGFILRLEGVSAFAAREVRVLESMAIVGDGKSARAVLVPELEELLLKSAEEQGHATLLEVFRKQR